MKYLTEDNFATCAIIGVIVYGFGMLFYVSSIISEVAK